MATIKSNAPLNISSIDMNLLVSEQTDFGFNDGINYTFDGNPYQDVVLIQYYSGGYINSYLGGSNIVFNANKTSVESGTVTGFIEYGWTGTSWTNLWSLSDFSYSAKKLSSAIQSASTSDDMNIIATILSGKDVFDLSPYDDTVNGYNGNDKIKGNAGKDNLNGGAGDDLIDGGAGKDMLYGGTGIDYFDFNSISESGTTSSTRDVIKDFSKSQGDKIDLRNIDAKSGGTSNDSFSFLSKAPTSDGSSSNGKIWYSAGVLYGSTDTDKAAEFSIQVTLVGVSTSNAADYILL